MKTLIIALTILIASMVWAEGFLSDPRTIPRVRIYQEPKCWEYDVLFVNQPILDKSSTFYSQANEWGKKGWELVAVDRVKDHILIAIFKRPRECE